MRTFAIAIAALLGAAALPATASAATCAASIIKTSGQTDHVLSITKDGRETLFRVVDFADIDGANTWLRVWSGGAMIDFGGCSGLAAVFDKVESYIRLYNQTH